ncbi:MAG: SusD/RagB family nutrient-binding outer membrane lipoprotein [Pricia sp.]
MKFNHKFKIIIVSLGVLFGCESIELDLTENPNQLDPAQASPDSYLNSIQVDYARLIGGPEGTTDITVGGLGDIAAQLTRIHNMFGRQYNQAFGADAFDNEWTIAYAKILSDLARLYPLAEEENLPRHRAIGKTIEAFTLINLTDFFGSIPYTEAIQGQENLNPSLNTGEEIYTIAFGLLDEAEAAFEISEDDFVQDVDFDLYYGAGQGSGADAEAWIRAINSMRLKMYAQTRLVNPDAVNQINAIIAEDNYISENSQDFQFRWGANLANPDSRNPYYVYNYIATGANDYMSNYLMNYMLTDKVDNGNATFEGIDPRTRYYFYRQTDATPGAGGEPANQQNLSCSVEPAPAHYVNGGFTFCSIPGGYWGRDHGDDDGIPPDGLLRATWGVYPNGGRFDDSSFEEVNQGLGGGGAGITPIILSSSIDFLRAEIALASGNTADARTLMLDGITKSFAKVRSFGALDVSADLTLAAPVSDDEDYIAEVGELYDAADTMGKLGILGEEFWVTLIGNGIDAYNFYRRVGAPFNLQPNLEPDPGEFARSQFYPGVFANNNSNVSQKSGVTERIFWDTNPETGFPIAN